MLYLFLKARELRSPANMFVVNLAFSDLCMMLTQFPMFVFNSFAGGVWLFGPFMCELYACLGSVFGMCSICTMAAISYDRYNVIVRGMNGPRMTSSNNNNLRNIFRFFNMYFFLNKNELRVSYYSAGLTRSDGAFHLSSDGENIFPKEF